MCFLFFFSMRECNKKNLFHYRVLTVLPVKIEGIHFCEFDLIKLSACFVLIVCWFIYFLILLLKGFKQSGSAFSPNPAVSAGGLAGIASVPCALSHVHVCQDVGPFP